MEREGSISSKISSIFRRSGEVDDDSATEKRKKKKEKKEKKRRRSSRLSQLLSFGSSNKVISGDDDEMESVTKSNDAESKKKKQKKNKKKGKKKEKKYSSVAKKDDDDEDDEHDDDQDDIDDEYEQVDINDNYDDDDDDDDYFDDDEDDDDEYFDDDEEEEEEVETKKKKKSKKKKPAMASFNAPRPRPMQNAPMKPKKKKKRKSKNADQVEIELEAHHRNTGGQQQEFSAQQLEAADFMAANLMSTRKYNQFNKIVQIGRVNRAKIENEPKLLARIVDNAISAGDVSMMGSKPIVKRATKLIKRGHPLFDDVENGVTGENEKRIKDLLRRQDVINTVFAGLGPQHANGVAGNFAYSPAELRKLEELPDRAPSQRPQVEKKTNIDDDVWEQANVAYDQRDLLDEDREQGPRKEKAKGVLDMDDIWEVTGALPPELMTALEDPYDAWKDKEVIQPIQRPLRFDEEDEYRDKMRKHFKRRRELLHRKYWLPRWCRYVASTILILLIIALIIGFLYFGNHLGAQFVWVPYPWDNDNCTISITEQTRFDYDYTLDQIPFAETCSPRSHPDSMPQCWDYRARFTICTFITFLTSILLVQPLYIAILSLIAVTCLPKVRPCFNAMRNACCGFKEGDPGYKEFLGGTIVISGDTNLEYGRIADDHRELGPLQDDEDPEHSLKSNHTVDSANSKEQHLLV